MSALDKGPAQPLCEGEEILSEKIPVIYKI